MSNLGDNIKKYRVFRKITQQEIADRLNKSKGVISNWERGDNQPNPEEVELLCRILNVTPNEIFGWEENREYIKYMEYMKYNEEKLHELYSKKERIQKEIDSIESEIAKQTEETSDILGTLGA